MTDPWIPFMVWCAAIAGLWIGCVLANRAWVKVKGWYDHWRDRRAIAKEIAAYGTAEAARRQHLNSFARAVRSEDRRELSERVRGDLAQRCYPTYDIFRINEAIRPTPQPHSRAQSGSHGAQQGGLGISDESGLGYALPRVGGDGDRAA